MSFVFNWEAVDNYAWLDFMHDKNYLSKKSELINKWRHINKFLLKNVKRWIW